MTPLVDPRALVCTPCEFGWAHLPPDNPRYRPCRDIVRHQPNGDPLVYPCEDTVIGLDDAGRVVLCPGLFERMRRCT